jgi:hypothetical protein
MTLRLDRPGIFRAEILSWSFKQFPGSLSKAISIQFKILEKLERTDLGNAWEDWSVYDEHIVWGDYWIVGRNGKLNAKTLEQLSTALDWEGDIRAIGISLPRNRRVQVTVKEEAYDGKILYKAQWLSPWDFVPGGGRNKHAPTKETLEAFQAEYGSQVRAALGAAAHLRGTPATPLKRVYGTPPKKVPETLCPVSQAEGAEPLRPQPPDDLPANMGDPNQDEGNPFGDVPDEAGDAPVAPENDIRF